MLSNWRGKSLWHRDWMLQGGQGNRGGKRRVCVKWKESLSWKVKECSRATGVRTGRKLGSNAIGLPID